MDDDDVEPELIAVVKRLGSDDGAGTSAGAASKKPRIVDKPRRAPPDGPCAVTVSLDTEL